MAIAIVKAVEKVTVLVIIIIIIIIIIIVLVWILSDYTQTFSRLASEKNCFCKACRASQCPRPQ